ncbi:MAG TPA: D-alanine--D-alanine ligase [Oligoflexia bacterium]|nr:D-alanine--D-alanine ligase [Oligoflexia bacterium]HMP49294.1 D-alanine--D-alanine ligase [Oligoflexia bacterium]
MKKKIAILFGGRSVEHEISVLSGLQAIEGINTEKFEVIPVYIAQTGVWYTGTALLNRSFYSTLPGAFTSLTQLVFIPEPGDGGGLFERGGKGLFSKKEKKIPVDVFLPVFHGQYGEDGCIQGLFELAGVPYAGPEVLISSVAMNKYLCKAVLESKGIPVLPGTTVKKVDARSDITGELKRIRSTKGLESFPLFIKPVNLGSSVGVGKAHNEAELQAALFRVFQFDLEAIVEPSVENLMEINVSVMESNDLGSAVASVVEIPVASGGFLSYEDKYLREGKGKKGGSRSEGMASLTRIIDPENLDPEIKGKVIDNALKAFKLMNGSGVVRFDFILNLDTGGLYLNEPNTIPGSLAFYLWERSRPPLFMPDILEVIIKGAEMRHAERLQLKRDIGFKALKG